MRRHIAAACDPISVKCGVVTQNDMANTAMMSKLKKRWTENEKLPIGRSGVQVRDVIPM